MSLAQRGGRALLFAIITLLTARALGLPDSVQWAVVALIALTSMIDLALRWVALIVVGLVLWALAHLFGLAPSAGELARNGGLAAPREAAVKRLDDAPSAAPTGERAALTAQLTALETARRQGVLTETEFQAAQQRAIDRLGSTARPEDLAAARP